MDREAVCHRTHFPAVRCIPGAHCEAREASARRYDDCVLHNHSPCGRQRAGKHIVFVAFDSSSARALVIVCQLPFIWCKKG